MVILCPPCFAMGTEDPGKAFLLYSPDRTTSAEGSRLITDKRRFASAGSKRLVHAHLLGTLLQETLTPDNSTVLWAASAIES